MPSRSDASSFTEANKASFVIMASAAKAVLTNELGHLWTSLDLSMHVSSRKAAGSLVTTGSRLGWCTRIPKSERNSSGSNIRFSKALILPTHLKAMQKHCKAMKFFPPVTSEKGQQASLTTTRLARSGDENVAAASSNLETSEAKSALLSKSHCLSTLRSFGKGSRTFGLRSEATCATCPESV